MKTLTILLVFNYNTRRRKLMFKKGFSIFKLIGWTVGLAVVLFLVFKASITGNIV